MTYQEALHVDASNIPGLALSCDARRARCPDFRFCDDAYNITHQLWYHQGMDAKAQRSFPYAADDGTPRAFLVGDILPRDGPGALLRALGLAGLGAAATLGDFTRRP